MLIKGASTLKSAGGGLKIAKASDKILDLIKVTRLTKILETYASIAEAAKSFTK
jgi:anti-anti-sigma regulatory factor